MSSCFVSHSLSPSSSFNLFMFVPLWICVCLCVHLCVSPYSPCDLCVFMFVSVFYVQLWCRSPAESGQPRPRLRYETCSAFHLVAKQPGDLSFLVHSTCRSQWSLRRVLVTHESCMARMSLFLPVDSTAISICYWHSCPLVCSSSHFPPSVLFLCPLSLSRSSVSCSHNLTTSFLKIPFSLLYSLSPSLPSVSSSPLFSLSLPLFVFSLSSYSLVHLFTFHSQGRPAKVPKHNPAFEFG